MRGCDITASGYNAATANARMLIRRRCSNAYNANARSRDATAANARSRDATMLIILI